MSDFNRDAIASAFLLHAEALRRFLRGRRDAHDADDLVQDGFERLLKSAASALPDHPRAWLYRACANLASDRHDWQKVRERLHDAADPAEVGDTRADPARQLAARQRLGLAWNALLRLSEPCRQAFLLNRLDGLSQREIAVHLGISEKTVERHVLRALEACRRAVDTD